MNVTRLRAGCRQQLGFTMFEVMVAIAVGSLALVAMIPIQIDKLERQQVDVAAAQIHTLGDLAVQYRTEVGTWPGAAAATPCDIAAVNADLIAEGYLAAALDRTAWGSGLVTTCTPVAFDVSANAPNRVRQEEAAARLHTASVAAAAPWTVTSRYAAGGGPSSNQFLHRVAIPGQPELNRMETAIDMDGNDIANVGNLTAGGMSTTGDAVVGGNLTVTGNSSLCNSGAPGCSVSLGNGRATFVTPGGPDMELRMANAGASFRVTNPANADGLGSIETGSVNAARGLRWANNSELVVGEGGSIELGGGGTDPANPAAIGRPYLDFHFVGSAQDYNVRVQNESDQVLAVSSMTPFNATLYVDGDIKARRNLEVEGGIASPQFINPVSQKSDAQAVNTVTIVAPDTMVEVPGYCDSLGMLPKIYTAPASFAEGPISTPIYQVRTYAERLGAQWAVRMNLLTENGVITSPDPNFNSVMVSVKCERA